MYHKKMILFAVVFCLLAGIPLTAQAQMLFRNSNSEELMRLTDEGKLGIGLTNPSATLEVVNTAGGNTLELGNLTGATDGFVLTVAAATGGVVKTRAYPTAATGDIIAVGDVTTGDAFTGNDYGNSLWFEGPTIDGREYQLTALDDPSVDRVINLPDASGTLALGTGAAGHVPYWSGTNTLAYDTDGNFIWDAVNNRLGIGTTATGNYKLHVAGDTYINGLTYTQTFRLGGSATAGHVLTTNALGVGTWQDASITTDGSLTGTGTTASPLSLGWSDISTSSQVALAAKSSGAGQTRVGYLAPLTFGTNGSDRWLMLHNMITGSGVIEVSAAEEAVLHLKGKTKSYITMFEPNIPESVILSANSSYPSGYESSTARLYTNAGLVTEGNANRFVNKVIVAVDVAGNAQPNEGVFIRSQNDGDVAVDNALYVNGNSRLNGSVYIPNMQTGTNTYQVYWDGSQLVRATSSVRYKENITKLQREFDHILSAEPIAYNYKNSQIRTIGYSAEDFDRLGLKDLVIYDQGVPDAISYEKVSIYLLEVVKNQQAGIKNLQERIRVLENKITK